MKLLLVSLDTCILYILCGKQTTVGGTPPSPRSGHSAVALGESLVVYGGMDGQEGVTFNDLFELQTGRREGVPLLVRISQRVSRDSYKASEQRLCLEVDVVCQRLKNPVDISTTVANISAYRSSLIANAINSRCKSARMKSIIAINKSLTPTQKYLMLAFKCPDHTSSSRVHDRAEYIPYQSSTLA